MPQPLLQDAPAPLPEYSITYTLPKVLRLSLDPPLTSIFSHIMTLPYRICHPSPIPNYSVIFYLTYTLILRSFQPYYTLIARNISLTQIIFFPKLQARPSPYPIPIPSHPPLQARPLTPSIQMNPITKCKRPLIPSPTLTQPHPSGGPLHSVPLEKSDPEYNPLPPTPLNATYMTSPNPTDNSSLYESSLPITLSDPRPP